MTRDLVLAYRQRGRGREARCDMGEITVLIRAAGVGDISEPTVERQWRKASLPLRPTFMTGGAFDAETWAAASAPFETRPALPEEE